MPRSSRTSNGKRNVEEKLRKMAADRGPGARLPSVRTLIQSCGVSQAIIAEALERLEVQGVLECRPRSGIFVKSRPTQRPRLILLEANIMVTPSPFSELLLRAITSPECGCPETVAVRFTNPLLHDPVDIAPIERMSPDLWMKVEGGHYASMISVGTDPKLNSLIEASGTPVVSFGSISSHIVRIAMLDACQVGVAELARLGCRRIGLYDTPFTSIRELFLAALSVHGVKEFLMPHRDLYNQEVASKDQTLVRRFSLFDYGYRAARRAFGKGNIEPKPDGLVSLDDLFTHGFIVGGLELGQVPGRDYQIATHVNIGSPVLAAWEPQLVRFEHSNEALARTLHEAATALEQKQPLASGWGRDSIGQGGATNMVYFLPLNRRVPAELAAVAP